MTADGPEMTPPLRKPLPRPAVWIGVAIGALALLAASIISLGVAAVVWAPLLLVLGATMLGVWAARRRRQAIEGRDSNELKDPLHAVPPWPTEGVTDDRLPQSPADEEVARRQ